MSPKLWSRVIRLLSGALALGAAVGHGVSFYVFDAFVDSGQDLFCGGVYGFVAEVESGGVECGFGVAELEAAERLAEDVRDGYVAEPLVVRRDDVPGSVLVAGAGEHVFIGGGVLVPEAALGEVGG
jgi:hypothetical protein